MKDGKVVIWVSSSTLGYDRATELGRLLAEQDKGLGGIIVHVAPNDISANLQLAKDRLRCTDILVTCMARATKVCDLNPYSTTVRNYEQTVFPTSNSPCKTVIKCMPDVPVGTVRPHTLNSADTRVSVIPCDEPIGILGIILMEVGRVLLESKVNSRVSQVETFDLGVALSLLKDGGALTYYVSNLDWHDGTYIKMNTMDISGTPIIYQVSGSEEKIWTPRSQRCLLSDRYFTYKSF